MTRHRGATWTDDNAHDPGVTLLQALAYAITDLAYAARRRLHVGRCGWRCAVLAAAGAAGAAGAVLLVRRRRRA